MARPKYTKQHNIYLIDKNKLAAKVGENDVQTMIELLMDLEEGYIPQTLKENLDTKGFTVKLFFRPEPNPNSKFSSFCKSFVADDQLAVRFHPSNTSSVLFVWNETKLFAITTGQGFRAIEDYSVPKFGLIVASIFEGRFKVTSLDSNAMSSVIHSTKTVYSNEVDFIDIDALDIIFKEVTGRLNDADKVRSLLNLKPDTKRKNVKITAKNYVQFSAALDFNGLLHLLTIISQYDIENLDDRFNLISPINNKKHAAIIEENNVAIINKMYRALKDGKQLPFDLFHRDTSEYIGADTYVIYDSDTATEYAEKDDFSATELIEAGYLAYLGDNPDTVAAFGTFILSSKIMAKKGFTTITDGSVLKHVSGEIQVNGLNYYVFYGDFYRLNDAYSERLNESLRGKLRPEFFVDEIKTAWDRKDEDWFNEQVSLSEGYIHLHKVKPEYIEFADLLKVEDDEVTIVHVKDGFDCDMRALDRQVEMSVTRIMDLKHNNSDSYMRKLYQRAADHKTGVNITSVFSTEQSFVDCMKKSSIRYIIVIRPKDGDLLNSGSNIAKHCLNALILRCFQQGIELRIQKV